MADQPKESKSPTKTKLKSEGNNVYECSATKYTSTTDEIIHEYHDFSRPCNTTGKDDTCNSLVLTLNLYFINV